MKWNRPVFLKPEFVSQFKDAFSQHQIVLFCAPIGCGKTAAAAELLRRLHAEFRNASQADCLDWNTRPLPRNCTCFVLDDLHKLRQPLQQKLLCKRIMDNPGKKFLLLTRGEPPDFLKLFGLSDRIVDFTTSSFLLDLPREQRLLEAQGLCITPAELAAIHQETHGYALFLTIFAQLRRPNAPYKQEMLAVAKSELFVYLRENAYNSFSVSIQTFLMNMAPFSKFSAEMAEYIGANKNTDAVLQKLEKETSVLTLQDADTYCFSPIFQEFLKWELVQEYPVAKRNLLLCRAGQYYESRGELLQALEYYSRCGEVYRISALLEKHAEKHPAIGQYYEVEPYYRVLPHEEILRSPSLMCGMSISCALNQDYTQAEYWYMQLVKYASTLPYNAEALRSAKGKIAYLDVALPQRGSKHIFRQISNLFPAIAARKIDIPEFSVTSMMPSIMNGGKDFCEWSPKDEALYTALKKPLEIFLGRDGVALPDCALCESKFEKGENISKRLLNLAFRLDEVQQKGTPDMEFALLGLLARNQMAQGQPQTARCTIESLRTRFIEEGHTRFLPNMDAMLCRIALRQNDTEAVESWYHEKAPHDCFKLRPMWRYQYLTQALVEIQNEEYEQALLPLARLAPYCEQCERHMDSIYIDLFSAVCRARMGDTTWQRPLCRAIDACYRYQFVRPVDQLGIAILPLLTSCGWNSNSAFLDKLIKAARLQAIHYPDFLHPKQILIKPLSVTEQQVLKLLCCNRSNQEIGEILDIKITTVKTHVRHILQKLSVSRRNEVKSAAEKLHLV